MDESDIEILTEVATDANGDIVPADDPTAVEIEITYLDRSTGEEMRTYARRT